MTPEIPSPGALTKARPSYLCPCCWAELGRRQDAAWCPVGTFGRHTKALPPQCRAQLAPSRLVPPRAGDTILNFACRVCVGRAGGRGVCG